MHCGCSQASLRRSARTSWIQVYPIAADIFNAGSGALSAHKAVGYVVLVLEVLTSVVGIVA